MTNEEFREWLRGFFELSDQGVVLDLNQINIITNHLNLAEAVAGRLDETNAQLSADIQAIRSRPGPKPEDLAAFTQTIQKRLY